MEDPARAYEDDPQTYQIIGCAMRVRTRFGVGLLESAYEAFFCHELRKAGFSIQRQVGLPVEHDGVRLEVGYRPDLIIDGNVIVEVKAVNTLIAVHEAQLLTYLHLTGIDRGLLFNFQAVPFKDGIRRLLRRKPLFP